MKKIKFLLLLCISFLTAIALHGKNISVLNNDDKESSPLMMFGEKEKPPRASEIDPRQKAAGRLSKMPRETSFSKNEREISDAEIRETEAAGADGNEELSFSDEQLDEVLKKAIQVKEYWIDIHVSTTTSPTTVQQLIDQLEREEALWESEQERLILFAEQMQTIGKLEAVIEACNSTLNTLRDQELQLLPRSYRSDNLISDEKQPDKALAMSIGSLSSKSAIASYFHDQSHFAELEQQAKSIRAYAQKRGEYAQREHQDARNFFRQHLLLQAEDYYQDAISSAKKAAAAWEQYERVYLELIQISGQKLRRWGQSLKLTWQERAKAWEKERSRIFELLEREQKIKEIQQSINEVVARKKELLDLQNSADQEARNEIGSVCRLIAGKSEILKTHYENAIKAYSNGEIEQAQVSEGKAAKIKSTIDSLNAHLIPLQDSMEFWKKNYPTEESRYLETREELQSDGKKKVNRIYKKHFIGPLLRIERITNAKGDLLEEIKMAAEHLALKLNREEDTRLIIQKLKENFQESEFNIEDVFPQTGLYRLCFSPSVSDESLTKRLDLFDRVRSFIQDHNLAVSCYPDFFSTVSSSNEVEGALKKKVTNPEEPKEPWALHSIFGINPPPHLFNTENLAIEIPPSPIILAIIDSGILATHQAFSKEAIFWPDENGDINDFSPYGYNATAVISAMKGYPEDTDGHGTHIAGIIAGLPHQVSKVEVKINKDTGNEYHSYHIPIACIQGVASIPGMIKFLICKNVEPGVIEDGYFILRSIECIRYAREHGAQVINCSWGRKLNDSEGISQDNVQSLQDALANPCELLIKNDQDQFVSCDPVQNATPIVAVTAAGNLKPNQLPEEGNRDDPANQYYPANFNLDNVISVSFSTKEGTLARKSCYGAQSIHLVAPGSQIISASCNGNDIYRILSGTSMAAPVVSASIALMIMKFGNLYSYEKLVDHLCENANRENLLDLKVRDGRLNLARALEVPQSSFTRLQQEYQQFGRVAGHKEGTSQEMLSPAIAPPPSTAASRK